jgi:hypothetical protein
MRWMSQLRSAVNGCAASVATGARTSRHNIAAYLIGILGTVSGQVPIITTPASQSPSGAVARRSHRAWLDCA